MKNSILVDDIDTSVLSKEQKKLFDRAFRKAMRPLEGPGIESHVAYSHGGKYMRVDQLAMGWKTCAIYEFLKSRPHLELPPREENRLMAILDRAKVLLEIVKIIGKAVK